LIAWAKRQGRQNELVDRIFVRYFAEGQGPAAHEMLAAAAVEAGLDGGEARAFLASSELADLVRAEAARVQHDYNVTGVPFFVVHADGSTQLPYGVPGAQDPDTLVKIIHEALKDVDTSSGIPAGKEPKL